jgi:hypothetical protein
MSIQGSTLNLSRTCFYNVTNYKLTKLYGHAAHRPYAIIGPSRYRAYLNHFAVFHSAFVYGLVVSLASHKRDISPTRSHWRFRVSTDHRPIGMSAGSGTGSVRSARTLPTTYQSR